MEYINNIDELVGNTPILKVNRMGFPEKINVFAKLELMNPGGSAKDRIGFQIIEDGEKEGLIDKDTVIIEPTAGNTGIGIALAAQCKGYKALLVVPEGYSLEKQIIMRAMGAEVVNTPKDKGMEGAIERAHQLVEELDNAYFANQYDNPSNPRAHYLTTGPEIYQQMDGEIDIFIAGAGTGGTFSGIVKYIKEHNPDMKAILVDPYGSILGEDDSEKVHKVEGMGSSFIPKAMDMELIDDVIKVTEEESLECARKIAQREGLTVGHSSGAVIAGIYKLVDKLKDTDETYNIVTIFADRSERYFSQNIYDDMHQFTKKNR